VTGEHFSSATGKSLDKGKDPYVRFRWREKKFKRGLATVLERSKLQEDKELWAVLEDYYKRGKSGFCVVCGKEETLPCVNLEFYNWEKPGIEIVCVAHDECLKGKLIKAKLDAFKLLGKNPTFNIELNCLSVEKCGLFSKASDFRNCEHIVLRFEEIVENNGDGSVTIKMSPLLHCKRAHPGEFFLEAEADTWWNIQNAGLALLAKRITEQLETPEVQGQLNQLKKEQPDLVEAYRKLIREQPINFAYSVSLWNLTERLILQKTPDEIWDEVVQGNDYY